MSSAESIAKTVADMKAGRIRVVDRDLRKFNDGIYDPVVVDATLIYNQLVEDDKPVYLYEDHPCIAPPWDEFAIAYENEHGNAIVMHAIILADDPKKGPLAWETDGRDDVVIEWDRVKWRLAVLVYCGGRGSVVTDGPDGPVKTGTQAFPTTGPLHMWSFAIYDDGEPADLHWVQLVPEYDMSKWDMAHLVILGALNFLNCRNIEIVEARTTRAEGRRIARTGVTVNTINVFPTSRATRSKRGEAAVGGVPLTTVRGHFAHYGPAYGRELLFGRIEGRFFIPQHARGSIDHGESEHGYRLVP